MQVKFQHDSHPTLHFLSALLMNNDVETGLLNKMQKTTIILSWRMELLRTYNLLWSNLTVGHFEPKIFKSMLEILGSKTAQNWFINKGSNHLVDQHSS